MKRIVSSPPNPGNPTPGHLVSPGKKYRPILRLLNSRSNDWSRERSNVSVPIPDCSSSRQKEQRRGRADLAEELLSGRLVACDCMAGQAGENPPPPSLSLRTMGRESSSDLAGNVAPACPKSGHTDILSPITHLRADTDHHLLLHASQHLDFDQSFPVFASLYWLY